MRKRAGSCGIPDLGDYILSLVRRDLSGAPSAPPAAITPASVARLVCGGEGPECRRRWRRRLEKAASEFHGLDLLLKAALSKALAEYEATGGITLPWAPLPMQSKLARRVTELNQACDLEPSDGIADALLEGAFNDFREGDGYLVYDVYDIKTGQREVKEAFVKMVQRWRKGDGLPALPPSRVKRILAENWSPKERRRRKELPQTKERRATA